MAATEREAQAPAGWYVPRPTGTGTDEAYQWWDGTAWRPIYTSDPDTPPPTSQVTSSAAGPTGGMYPQYQLTNTEPPFQVVRLSEVQPLVDVTEDQLGRVRRTALQATLGLALAIVTAVITWLSTDSTEWRTLLVAVLTAAAGWLGTMLRALQMNSGKTEMEEAALDE